ncbi:TetR/AcrR family transcriptional regulator [Actinomyces sp. zg-332]|uniref:TetR/AcrR family transcriptional regulator n=1 Tax=Actinomyces sp. zg-332 TaxID=2708340 RepID=UPI0014244975|nr:TetR/AcrR family transcriptional regulator [Actinomyces sp. zg-332]QPK94169.1 TetR/AcrR family transcriptional regulator [Actinomyces sp. zg-332]
MTNKQMSKRNKENTKINLLSSAKELFIKHGIASTTIENITKNAGYTRGAFYSTFESKDELIQILMHEEFANLVKAYSQNLFETTKENTERLDPEQVIELILTKVPLDLDFHIIRTEFYLYAIRTPECIQPYKDAMRYTKNAFSQTLIEYLDKMNLRPTISMSNIIDTIMATINITMHNVILTEDAQNYPARLAKSIFPKILKATTQNITE